LCTVREYLLHAYKEWVSGMTKEMIEWYDHFGNNDPNFWRTKTEIIERCQEDFVIQSHGEVIHEDRNKVIIAANKRVDLDLSMPLYQDYTVIYKKLIRNREKL